MALDIYEYTILLALIIIFILLVIFLRIQLFKENKAIIKALESIQTELSDLRVDFYQDKTKQNYVIEKLEIINDRVCNYKLRNN